MTAIGGGFQPQVNRRENERSARYEQVVTDYYNRVGEYPAMPIQLTPNNGVPIGERLDTFHKMTQNLGVTVTSDLEDNALPVGERGYRQLLNTVASIVENGNGFLERLKRIALKKDDTIGASMYSDGLMQFEYIVPKPKAVADENLPTSSVVSPVYDSSLDSVDAFKVLREHSLRTTTGTTEHEAVHDLLMEPCREFIEKSEFRSIKPGNLADSIMEFYIQQLRQKNPAIMDQAAKHTMLTDYFISSPQELFTTLFEANVAEIASRTPITQEMADAVGSTVEHLTRQRETYMPTVSTEQREQLTALINLMRGTPFNLTGWLEDQYHPKHWNVNKLNLPPIDYPIVPEVDKLLVLRSWDSVCRRFRPHRINTLADLDRQNSELYQFILELDTQHPDLLSVCTRALNDESEILLQSLLNSVEPSAKKPLSDFIDLLYPPSRQEALTSMDFNTVLGLLKRLHSSYKFIEATGGRPVEDDLFYTQHRAKGLPIPVHPIQETYLAAKAEAEERFLAGNAHLLDLPQRLMTMFNQLDEKELMITLLHELV